MGEGVPECSVRGSAGGGSQSLGGDHARGCAGGELDEGKGASRKTRRKRMQGRGGSVGKVEECCRS